MSKRSNKQRKNKVLKHRENNDKKTSGETLKNIFESIFKNVFISVISGIIGISGIVGFFLSPYMQNKYIEINRYNYFDKLNNQVDKTINFNAESKFRSLLEETDKEEYRDLHDYFSGLAKAKSGDNKGALYYFAKIPPNKSLYPAAIYSRIQCGLMDAVDDADKKTFLSNLLIECESHGRENNLEGFLVKLLLRKMEQDLEGIISDIEKFEEIFSSNLKMNWNENILFEDCLVIETIRFSLIVTALDLSDKMYISNITIEKDYTTFLSDLYSFSLSEYFGVGDVAMVPDVYILPEIMDILNKKGYDYLIMYDTDEYIISSPNGKYPDNVRFGEKRKFK